MVSLARSERPRLGIAAFALSCLLLLPIALALLALWLPGLMAPAIADDAFFFVRYAHIFLEEGRFAWNAGEAASFGNTSQLYQFWIAAVQAAIGYDPVRVLAAGSQVPLALCVAAVLIASARMVREDPAQARGPDALVLLLAGTAILFSPKFAHTAWSGMDTALAAFVTAVYAGLVDGIEGRGARAQAAILALGGWVLILARPELGLIAVATPAALALGRESLRAPILSGLAGLGLLVAASVGAAWLFYGDPLPLPFYVKSLGLSAYGAEAVHRYHFGNLEEIYLLFRDHAVLVLLLLACAAPALRGRPAWWGLLGGSAAFVLYQAFANAVPISGGGARFLMPVYPILVLAVVRAAIAGTRRSFLPRSMLAACLVLQAAMFAPPYLDLLLNRLRDAPQAWALRNDARATLLLNWPGQREKWPALDRMAELPAGCAIATTELGLIGALYPELRMVDLSGLVNRRLKHGFDPEWLLSVERPDILFPGTAEFYWGVRLDQDAAYREAYAPLQISQRIAPWPIAVRKDSSCGQIYAAILAEEERKPRP
jgi:hypothetical protein